MVAVQTKLRFLLLSIAAGASQLVADVAEKDRSVTAAVFSVVRNGYKRTSLPDGTLKKEYYALARGRYVPGTAKDRSIDDVEFAKISTVLREYLAKQNYYLAEDSKSAELLLMVTWGTTIPADSGMMELAMASLSSAAGMNAAYRNGPSGWLSRQLFGSNGEGDAPSGGGGGDVDMALLEMQSANAMRLRADDANARLLGYNQEIVARDNISRYAGNADAYDSLIADVEEERYYVIVTAYDFKAATRDGKQVPLWSTRVSIRVRSNRFDDRFQEMIASASRYFGQRSPGLVRAPTSPGTITLKELEILGTAPTADAAKPPPSQPPVAH